MEWISDPAIWTALATLVVLEVVLGVDNVIFISILASKLPAEQQGRARQVGLLAAGGMRLLLLLTIGWIISLKKDLFTAFGQGISGKDIILILGGLFLIYKSTKEIHEKLEGEEGHVSARVAPTFAAVIAQVMLLDLVFSIDSVITAVGMTPYLGVMIAAVVISVIIMLTSAKAIYEFVNKHPTIKMLALSFLLLIGVTLIAEGLGQKIPKGYIYFSIAFAMLVEILNLRARSKSKPVHLHEAYVEEGK
jgi:predicted tellurium resistance membrane protein TerC